MRPLTPDPKQGRGRGQPPRFYARRDRAPSRLAFRLERLWLTPAVRAVTRIGAPIFVVTLGLGLWLGDSGRRADLVERYDNLKISIENRPEFMVSRLEVTGASPAVEDAVRMMLPVGLPASRFAIDLNSYRDAIERLDAVRDVSLTVLSGGALEARVTEREPVILWRKPTGLDMLDADGHRVASLTRRDARPDLALIAGDGADKAVPEALDILAAAQPLLPKMRGLIRVGERRWDVDLVGGRRIELPAKDPVPAMKRVIEVDRSDDLLSRDFTRIDMRDTARPTVRLSANALEHYEELTGQKPRSASFSAQTVKPVAVSAPAASGSVASAAPVAAAAPSSSVRSGSAQSSAAQSSAAQTSAASSSAAPTAARPAARPSGSAQAAAAGPAAAAATPAAASPTRPQARPLSNPSKVAP